MAFFFFKKKSHRETIFHQLCCHLYSPFKDTASCPVPAFFFLCFKPLLQHTNSNTLDSTFKKRVLLNYSDLFILIFYCKPKLTQVAEVCYFSQNAGKSICKNLLQITTGKDAPEVPAHCVWILHTQKILF